MSYKFNYWDFSESWTSLFFSLYTLPTNQEVTINQVIRIFFFKVYIWIENLNLIWILFLIFAMLCSVLKKTAFGCNQDATAVSWCLLKMSKTIPLFWKQIDIQTPEKGVHVLVFMCFHCVVFLDLSNEFIIQTAQALRTPCFKSLVNNGLVVIIKKTNVMSLIPKISVSNSSYLGRRGIVCFPSTAAENWKFSGINSKLS